ncbi:MAG TPA: hypothetical protein VLX91_01375 [Candidatus Acidoferrales bacterium]|nr:hypothetical protein [Candidatus Acidoferrales bacterium]
MAITKEHLDEFKRLYKEDGIEVSDGAALEAGLWLLERVKAVCVQIPEEMMDKYKEIVKENKIWLDYLKREFTKRSAGKKSKKLP